MSVVYLSTAYLAPVAYYKALCRYDSAVVEACSHYVKQSYRNRCTIMTAGGELSLSIPVERTRPGKPFTRDMRISGHDNWQHVHWNAIASAYGSSPFLSITATTSILSMRSRSRGVSCSITTGNYRRRCAVCWVSRPGCRTARPISMPRPAMRSICAMPLARNVRLLSTFCLGPITRFFR